jgi:predicted small secreted protein
MNDYEKMEQEKLNIQKAQLVAQSVTAWETRKNAENTKKIAEEAERSRKINEVEARREALHRREMAARQAEILEDQKTTNFRQTILTTLPMLEKEEKNQYVIEQLLPKVIERRKGNGSTFKDVVQIFGFPEFVASFSANPEIEQFLTEDKKQKNGLVSAVQAYIDAEANLKQTAKKIGKKITLVISIVLFVFLVRSCNQTEDIGEDRADLIVFGFLGVVAFYFVGKHIIGLCVENSGPFKPLREKIKVLKADAKKKKDAYDLHPAKYIAAWNKIKTILVDSYLASDSGQKFLKGDLTSLSDVSWTKAVAAEQAFLPPSARPPLIVWGEALVSQIQEELEFAKQRQSQIREILLSRICLIDSSQESSGEIGLYETQAFGLREIDKEFIELDLCRSTDETILPNEAGFQKGRIFLEAVKLQTDG